MKNILINCKKSLLTAFFLLSSKCCFASTTVGGDLPWDHFLKTISDDLSSNVVLAIGIMAIIACGLTMAFADLQSGGKRALTIGIGLSVAFSSASLITKLFATGAII